MLTLEEERKSLLEAVGKHGFHIFWGAPHAYNGPTLYWNRNRQPELETFLNLAKAEQVNTLFLDWDQLRDKDLDWVRNISDTDYDKSPAVDIELLLQHVGEIGRITVGYFKNGVCHMYERVTPWFDELLRLEESTRERGPES
jgi:hypothetical protein